MKKAMVALMILASVLAMASVAGATPNGTINPIIKVDSVTVGK